jgi:nicotinate phosphoribosyltransferase
MPGRKQVFRRFDNGVITGDTLTVENDPQEGTPLIGKVMEKGIRLAPALSWNDIATYAKEQYKTLPESLKNLSADPSGPVRISSVLLRLQEETAAAIS